MKRNGQNSSKSFLEKLCRSLLSLALMIGICVPTFAFGTEQDADAGYINQQTDDQTESIDTDDVADNASEPVPSDCSDEISNPSPSVQDDSSDSNLANSADNGVQDFGSNVLNPSGTSEASAGIQNIEPMSSTNSICPVCNTAHAEHGTCGSKGRNLSWCLSGTVLTISGSGNMMDFPSVSDAPWGEYRSSIASVVVEDGVTSIGDYAFGIHPALSSASIPDSVSKIGTQAFFNCTSLGEFHLPSSLASIGSQAFFGCTSLKGIQLPSGIKTIGTQAFYKCYLVGNLDFPKSLQSIGDVAFGYCRGMSSISLPYLSTKLGSHVFQNCSGVKEVTLPEGMKEIPDGLLYGTSIVSFDVPESVTSIGAQAFMMCRYMKTLSIPSTVTSIGDNAFYACMGLKSIEIPGSVKSSGAYMFSKCSGLETVVLGEGFGSLDDGAFSECVNLKSVNLPENMAGIGQSMFYKCSSLEDISIPETVTFFGDSAFASCRSLKSINIPSSLRSVGRSAFEDCVSLPTVVLPEGIERIESRTFYNCSSFDSMLIPSTVAYIGDLALAGNYSTIIFEGTPELDGNPFGNMKLNTVTVPAGSKAMIESSSTLKSATQIIEFVSKVDGIYYDTVAKAVRAAGSAPVRLYADAYVFNASEVSGSVTLNLSGHTLTIPGGTHKGSLVASGGSIVVANGVFNGSIVVNGGSLSIAKGTFNGDVAVNGGNLAVSGGMHKGGISVNEGGFAISGGTYDGRLEISEGVLEISGGTFNGVLAPAADANVAISYGVFKNEPSKGWLATDHTKVTCRDGCYEVGDMDFEDLVSGTVAIPDGVEVVGVDDIAGIVVEAANAAESQDAEAAGASSSEQAVDDETMARILGALNDFHRIDTRFEVVVQDKCQAPSEDVALIEGFDSHGVEVAFYDIHVAIVDESVAPEEGVLGYVQRLSSPVTITVALPGELVNDGHSFYMVRIHDGVAERIDGTYDGEAGTFSFETDRFCTFALEFDHQWNGWVSSEEGHARTCAACLDLGELEPHDGEICSICGYVTPSPAASADADADLGGQPGEAAEALESVSGGFGMPGNGDAFTGGAAVSEGAGMGTEATDAAAEVSADPDRSSSESTSSHRHDDKNGNSFPLWFGGVTIAATSILNIMIFRRKFGF